MRKKDRYGWFKVSDQVFVSQQGVSANHCCSQMINKETSQMEGVLWGQDRQAVGHREGQLVWNLHPILLPALHVHWNNQRDKKFYLELMIALGSRTKWTTCAESDKYTKQTIEDGNFTFISSWSTIQGRTPDLRRLIVLMTLTLEASQLLSRLVTTSLPSIFGRSARRLGLQRKSPRTVSFDTLLFVFMEGIFLWEGNWSVQTYNSLNGIIAHPEGSKK